MDWNQLRTILWLRWRLTRNQWSRGSPVHAIIALTVAGGAVIAGTGGILLGLTAGSFLLNRSSATDLLIAWDLLFGMFLFLWVTGLLWDIQRSETIDLGRMLYLPVSLKQVFFINYLASHLSLPVILLVPGMLGLSVGLVLGRGWYMFALLPLVVGSIFMVTAWTYCLRGWLTALMSNPRRRRTIIALMAFIAVVAGQLPNLIGIAGRRLSHQPRAHNVSPPGAARARQPHTLSRGVLIAHQAVPFLWIGNGAMGLVHGDVLPAFWGTAAAFGIGTLGLRRAYRSTLRFYQGAGSAEVRVKRPAPARQASASTFLEKRLPGVPEEAAATALATFRSLTRAPEVKMSLAINLVMILILGATVLASRSHPAGSGATPFIATGTILFMCLGMSQLLFNQFGYDRAGFRTLVLSPAPRRWILLGKNLALLPIVAGIGAILLILLKFALGVPALILVATGLQLLAVFLLLSTIGNLVSVLVPYRMAPGALKPTKTRAGTGFLMFLLHLLFPLMVAPAFLAPLGAALLSRAGWLRAAPANLLFSSLLLALALLCYRRALPSLGGLLQQREKNILDVVTHEVE
jgi:ABC-2 type transport system permease protein